MLSTASVGARDGSPAAPMWSDADVTCADGVRAESVRAGAAVGPCRWVLDLDANAGMCFYTVCSNAICSLNVQRYVPICAKHANCFRLLRSESNNLVTVWGTNLAKGKGVLRREKSHTYDVKREHDSGSHIRQSQQRGNQKTYAVRQ